MIHPWTLADAKIFATRAHSEQTRKDKKTPYIVHPQQVVTILEGFGIVDPHVLAAAWLHDVVEDCGIQIEEIESIFGEVVADYVYYLTKEKKGSKEEREKRYVKKLKTAPVLAKLIKLADVIANLTDMGNLINMDYNLDKYLTKKLVYLDTIVPHLKDVYKSNS